MQKQKTKLASSTSITVRILTILLAVALLLFSAIGLGISFNVFSQDIELIFNSSLSHYSAFIGLILLAVILLRPARHRETSLEFLSSVISKENPEYAFPSAIILGLFISCTILYFIHSKIPDWGKLPWTVIASSATAPLLLLLWYWRHMHKQEDIRHSLTRILDERFKNAVEHIGHGSEATRMGGIHELMNLCKQDYQSYAELIAKTLESYIRNQVQTIRNEAKSGVKDLYLCEDIKIAIESLQEIWKIGGEAAGRAHRPNLSRINLSGFNLSYLNLSNTILSQAILQNVNLTEAFLSHTNLQCADLEHSNLQKANLQFCNLQRANLQGIDFSHCDMRNCQLQSANLKNTIFKGTYLNSAQLSGTNLAGNNMQGVRLVGAKLSMADLREAHLAKADLSEANLSKANLNGADLRAVSFKKANLTDATLIGANLQYALFSDAKLIGTNFQFAKLISVGFREAKLRAANLDRTICDKSNFQDANFDYTSLAGTDLSKAKNLTYEQLDAAYGVKMTKLPAEVECPPRWLEPRRNSRYDAEIENDPTPSTCTTQEDIQEDNISADDNPGIIKSSITFSSRILSR